VFSNDEVLNDIKSVLRAILRHFQMSSPLQDPPPLTPPRRAKGAGGGETITFVSALRHDKVVAPMVIAAPMNGEIFLAYVEQCLAPTLQRDDIVVMDNPPAHKAPGIEEAVAATGARLHYLPQYSLDLNPIEMPYAKFKAYLRKLAERTVPGLYRAMRSFLGSLKPPECANYLRHAGYGSI